MRQRQIMSITLLALAAFAAIGAAACADRRALPSPPQVSERERAISEATESNLPGNRLVLGRIVRIRSEQLEIDIGNPHPLYIPLKPAQLKGQTFKAGDAIVVTLNDHNAVVDYHHPGELSHHQVVRGRLSTPLTVGLDKAVIDTADGTKTFIVAEQAKGKLTAMPVGPELWFLADETGLLVDAQLGSTEAVRESAENNKARIKGAHRQVEATFQGTTKEGRLKINEEGRNREVPYRPPLPKLERLTPGQDVVLLMDDQGYVLEIAAQNVEPIRQDEPVHR